MREIKFRAWTEESKKMFDVTAIEFKDCYLRSFIHREETAGLLVGPGDNGEQENWESSPILMQFTGLKDKNGKEIYERDVVQKKDGKLFEVKYEFGYFFPLVELEFNPDTWGSLMEWEVIGNVYENPELLKRKTDT